MRSVRFLALAWLPFVFAPLQAADLTEVDRSILQEPPYQSQPTYCLLAFGQAAASRVWLVHDADVLYVDRNGNGDLTEPGERTVAKDATAGWSEFEAGDLSLGGRTHKNLRVSLVRQPPANNGPAAKAQPAENRRSPRCSLMLDVEMPGRSGRGIGGRVEQAVAQDVHGFLEFGAEPRVAPVVHFDGPWQVTLFGPHRFKVGRSTALYLAVGSPGIGAGSTAYLAYDQVIPEGVFPRAEIAFPPQRPGASPVDVNYELKRRCCMVNFHDLVRVPENCGAGEAAVTLSFDGVPGLPIGPSKHQIKVVREARGFEAEPVSPRLKAVLVHPDRKGFIGGLSYSPDGQRIIASNLPDKTRNGIIQVWDAASGKELNKLETGREDTAGASLFSLTPDGRTVLLPLRGERSYERIEKDGKPLMRFKFGGSVQAWDLESGKLLRTYQRSPGRQIFELQIAPDGATFVTFEVLPGEFARQPSRSASLWSFESGAARNLPTGMGPHGVYAPDGQTLAVAAVDDQFHTTAIKLIDMTTAEETLSISIAEQNVIPGYLAFTPDGKTLVGQLRGSGEHWLKFWDAQTGKERLTVAGEKGNLFVRMAVSPDSRKLALTTEDRRQPPKLFVFDVADGKLCNTISLDDDGTAFEPVFSPDSQWIAVTTQRMPENISDIPEAEDLPQPHIHLIRVSEGKVVETIAGPQGLATLLRFSPDGSMLASNGDGQVLLWDLANPPLAAAH